jgi:hypothetical protein
VSDPLGATGLALAAGEYCYYGVSNELAAATKTVALTFGGPGLLVYALANGTASADATTTPAGRTFPADFNNAALYPGGAAAGLSASAVLALGTAYQLGQAQTAVLLLINNSTTAATATLVLTASDSAATGTTGTGGTGTGGTGTGTGTGKGTETGALSGMAVEFLSFAVLCLGVFAF